MGGSDPTCCWLDHRCSHTREDTPTVASKLQSTRQGDADVARFACLLKVFVQELFDEVVRDFVQADRIVRITVPLSEDTI
ncbi:hypothetical protein RA29_17520 [Tateyamaria sp. ANG-S1]|nr:hypothetical protein RA29_17520 [Tateyamaria sp. ANG-S1]